MNARRIGPMLLAALVAVGCSTVPQRDAALENARVAVDGARTEPLVTTFAPVELRAASDAFYQAEATWRDLGDADRIRHLAYLAQQRAEIAQQAARMRAAEAAVASANLERDRVRSEARAFEAQQAQREATLAQMQADAARQSAQNAQTQAAIDERRADASQQQAQDAERRTRMLEQLLAELNAQPTDRGLVVTLPDMLFDSGRADLKPGAVRTIERLAEYLQRNPSRGVAIEGFTDSVGNDAANRELSERRAEAVRMVLIDLGVAPSRMVVRGYGKAYPVASNDSPEGRQLNRRVEVVISEDVGRLSARSPRTER